MLRLEAIGVRVTDAGITHVVCLHAGGKTKMHTAEECIAFVTGGNEMYTSPDGIRQTRVRVVGGELRGPYLRTEPNDSLEDNLLSLPRY